MINSRGEIENRPVIMCELEDGKILPYDLADKNLKGWPGFEYLGKGRTYSVDGVRQTFTWKDIYHFFRRVESATPKTFSEMNQRDRIKEAKGKLAREFTIADSYEVEKDLTVLKCRGISLKVFDLLAEALESEHEQDRFERLLNALAGAKECMDDLNRRCSMLVQEYQEFKKQFQPEPAPVLDLKVGDEVWVSGKVTDIFTDNIITVRLDQPKGTTFRYLKSEIRKAKMSR